jgi:signal transduction histidine kinase
VYAAAVAIGGAAEYAVLAGALRGEEEKRRASAFRMAAIAHELKTPLTAIQGSSEMISAGLLAEPERVEMAGLIHKESKRLASMIQTFLDVERMAAGTLALERRPVDLAALCEETLGRARLYAGRKRTEIRAQVTPGTIEADPDLLSFAIYNLLTNAVKYSPARSTVEMEARVEGGTATISVADRGYGIASEEHGRIFERFYRLERDRGGAESGSGIGLALVKEIVAQHGGRVTVESRPGAGSRFTLTLPAKSHA